MATIGKVMVPDALRPGDRVHVVAPSGPFDRTLVLRGLGWLAERYEVRFGQGLFAREGFLAGSDFRRASELDAALRDPKARAIVAARGGYGLTRIAHAVDVAALRDHPKWIVGFSDITALHVEASRRCVASLHAHNLAGLGREDGQARQDWVAAIEHPERLRSWSNLVPYRGGTAVGPVFGGNLTVLFTCAAAGRLRVPRGAVLFIEDIAEAPYRVDRMLTALISAGAFDDVAAVVVGEFTDAAPGRHGVPIESVLRERLEILRVPVVAGFPGGHGRCNDPLHLGMPARVDGGAGAFQVGSAER